MSFLESGNTGGGESLESSLGEMVDLSWLYCNGGACGISRWEHLLGIVTYKLEPQKRELCESHQQMDAS